MPTPILAGREVDVTGIEREIVRLLRQPENLSASGRPGMRTAVVNLVTYAADRPMIERVAGVIGALADHHPSRSIVIFSDGNATAQAIDARVQVQCRPMGTSGVNACVDQIIIESHPQAMRRVPGVVLPLLVADLPVIFWWPGEPPLRDPLLYDLLDPANRFVVDTANFIHVERTLLNLHALRKRRAIDLGDLNWGRLLPWRELVAQFWDVPKWRTRLSRLDRIEIELGKPAGGRSNRAQALLLVGWLASRLGWTPLSLERLRNGYRLQARQRRSTVEITIRVVPDQPSGLRAVRFHDRHPRGEDVFSITAGEDDCAVMVVQQPGQAEIYSRQCRIEPFDEAELLARELDIATGEVIFEHALEAAAAFLAAAR